jgi:hypothetical protein
MGDRSVIWVLLRPSAAQGKQRVAGQYQTESSGLMLAAGAGAVVLSSVVAADVAGEGETLTEYQTESARWCVAAAAGITATAARAATAVAAMARRRLIACDIATPKVRQRHRRMAPKGGQKPLGGIACSGRLVLVCDRFVYRSTKCSCG